MYSSGFRHIVITGASSGIGAALAAAYAAPGTRLSLAARRLDGLNATASLCRDRGAIVEIRQCDVTDETGVRFFFDDVEGFQPIDLVVINSGIFDGNGPDGQLETPAECRRMIETNLQGAIYCAQAAMVPMMARRRGHIAFVSSLAAWVPLADAPTYSATKAGVAAYGEALREFLLDYGVSVTTILPGHVRTAQTDAHMGATPMIIAPEQAARHITRGLARGNAVIAFPLAASWLTSLLAIAPWRLRARFARPSRFSCRKPVSRESLDLP